MDLMYFEDEPGREDYPGDYSPEDYNLEETVQEKLDIEEDKVEDKIVIEDLPEDTSEKSPEDDSEDKIEISDEPEMRKIPEDTVVDSEASEDIPEVMIRSPVLASKTKSEPKSKFFTELGDFDEIKIGRLDGNSGNLATFL